MGRGSAVPLKPLLAEPADLTHGLPRPGLVGITRDSLGTADGTVLCEGCVAGGAGPWEAWWGGLASGDPGVTSTVAVSV